MSMTDNEKIGHDDTWEFYKDASGEWRWTRTARNGEIVGVAHEGYVRKEDCVRNAERAGYERGVSNLRNQAGKPISGDEEVPGPSYDADHDDGDFFARGEEDDAFAG